MPRGKRAARSSNKPDTGANLGFEAKLWQAADALRNNMDAAEYKHVVLGLIFLKYISDAFEAKHAALDSERAKGAFGSDIKTDNFVDAGVPVIRGVNLTNGFVEEGFVYVTEQKADQLRNANAFPGDIVVTHRGTLGQVGLIPADSRFARYVVSQSQMVLSPDIRVTNPRFIFEYLRSADGQHQLLAGTSQTGVPAIARPTTSLKMIQLVLPPIALLHRFEACIGPLADSSVMSVKQSRTLAELRNVLLPKLVSGELRIKDAERVAAGAL